MFQLDDLRKSKVWPEAHGESREEGMEKGRTQEKQELVLRWDAEGKSIIRIAELLKLPVAAVCRLACR